MRCGGCIHGPRFEHLAATSRAHQLGLERCARCLQIACALGGLGSLAARCLQARGTFVWQVKVWDTVLVNLSWGRGSAVAGDQAHAQVTGAPGWLKRPPFTHACKRSAHLNTPWA